MTTATKRIDPIDVVTLNIALGADAAAAELGLTIRDVNECNDWYVGQGSRPYPSNPIFRAPKKVTATQLRAHLGKQGYEVRVSMDGHVTYRLPNAAPRSPWLDGRWVSEYRWIDGVDGPNIILT